MFRYTTGFKKKIVLEVIEKKKKMSEVAKKYKIPSVSTVKNWVDKYKSDGICGLEKRCRKGNYSYELKLEVVKYYHSKKATYLEVANKYNIGDASTIFTWVRKFEQFGATGLKDKGVELYSDEEKRNRKREKRSRRKTYTYEEYHTLLERNEELQAEVDYLKAWRSLDQSQQTNTNKARTIHELRNKYKLSTLLKVANMGKSSYEYCKNNFDKPRSTSQLEKHIIEIAKANPAWGYKRVYGYLKVHEGININMKKVHRLWKLLGLQVTKFSKKNRFSTYRGAVGKRAPNRLKRHFDTDVLHQKITTDTTEFKYYMRDQNGVTRIGKLYLDPFMDLCNKEIISYSISNKPSAKGILKAQEEAINVTNDCEFRRMFHSDQGWAYQMNNYRKALKDNNILQSMSRKGNCHDNSVMENFFGLLKQEMYYGYTYSNYYTLRREIINYINYYNNYRIKENLGWLSPVQYRLEKMKNNEFRKAA